ncbi:hypothetical protein CIPAW_12G032100 [Carya illinoinensis]|uniref:Uncharacterized protein n=1 Tax=Carya illinoinensis TaxID=32201 RepID=A0A8T1NU86_CARIL|nr:hypothetical protein CIPAW_12G032100 [Carya illinoinensis]
MMMALRPSLSTSRHSLSLISWSSTMWILYGICVSRNGLARSAAFNAVNASKSSSTFCSDALVAVVVVPFSSTTSVEDMERSIEPKRMEVGLTWRRMTASPGWM